MIKKRRRQTTKKDSGVCCYCRQTISNQMIMLNKGSNAKYRRWICDACLDKRKSLGLVKPGQQPNQYERTN